VCLLFLPGCFCTNTLTSRPDSQSRWLDPTLKGNVTSLQQRVILETKYVELWAIELDCVMDRDQSLAGKRPEMIKVAR
jgi:hypothetical protein